MKRKDIMKKLRAAGLIFEEGANHTKVLNAKGNLLTVVPRHAEVLEVTVAKIAKEAGVKLK